MLSRAERSTKLGAGDSAVGRHGKNAAKAITNKKTDRLMCGCNISEMNGARNVILVKRTLQVGFRNCRRFLQCACRM